MKEDSEQDEGSESKGHHVSKENPTKDKKKKIDEEKLAEARREYEQLRSGAFNFKKDKMGSHIDENNIDVQSKFSALQIQR